MSADVFHLNNLRKQENNSTLESILFGKKMEDSAHKAPSWAKNFGIYASFIALFIFGLNYSWGQSTNIVDNAPSPIHEKDTFPVDQYTGVCASDGGINHEVRYSENDTKRISELLENGHYELAHKAIEEAGKFCNDGLSTLPSPIEEDLEKGIYKIDNYYYRWDEDGKKLYRRGMLTRLAIFHTMPTNKEAEIETRDIKAIGQMLPYK